MNIAMITSEANPLCKSGGLADVTYSLSRQINKSKTNKAYIVLPFYKTVKNNKKYSFEYLTNFTVRMSWREAYVGVFKTTIDNIDYYLIDNEQYFNRDGLYGHGDDGERFAYFSLASLEAIKRLNLPCDIVHVHDWQAGMVPCIIKEQRKDDPFYKGVKTMLTIHNPAFKGFIDKYFLNNFYNLGDYLYDNGSVRFDNMVSTLKSAIVFSDIITTVSPTHRNELLTRETSFGFSDILQLRKDDFYGIVNGVDDKEFNPKTDKKIAKKYSVESFEEEKLACKQDLFKALGMSGTNEPVYGLVSRLTWQKGIDYILQQAEYLISRGAKLAIVGSGEADLENGFRGLREKYPNHVGLFVGYSDELAHKVYAGSDFFLMPSLFEPCGISQIIAQRYGSLPIARATGGLVDTVKGYNFTNNDADGFMFYEASASGLYEALRDSLSVYYENKETLNKLIRNAMNLNRNWAPSTKEYVALYRKALSK